MELHLEYPKVSIIIPVYNGAKYMRDAIDSALAQTYKNIEVLVINDGSNDDGKTEQIAKSYGDRIRYYSKPNGGVATALNLGIEKMKGEYFSWLSHDDIYLPDKIAMEISCLNTQEDPTTIVAEGYKFIDSIGKYISTMNLHQEYPDSQLNNSCFLLLRGGVNGCALLIHKSHFERVGLFDPQLLTTQDYDLWFRMFRGQKICYMPTSNVLSRCHNEQGSIRQFEMHIAECDQLWIKMMDELSPQEKESFGGTEFSFYCDLWRHLEYTSYTGALRHAQIRMAAAAINEYLKNGDSNGLDFICKLMDLPRELESGNILPENFSEKDRVKINLYLEERSNAQVGCNKISKVFRQFNNRFLHQMRPGEVIKKSLLVWKRYGFIILLKKVKRKIISQFTRRRLGKKKCLQRK